MLPRPLAAGIKKVFSIARACVLLVSACAGLSVAQEMIMLEYWWVMPREAPKNAPRVIRVLGEKGERYEEVYAA